MNNTKVIKSAKIAKILLQNGFTITSISQHRHQPMRTVFCFINSIELENFLSKLKDEDKE